MVRTCRGRFASRELVLSTELSGSDSQSPSVSAYACLSYAAAGLKRPGDVGGHISRAFFGDGVSRPLLPFRLASGSGSSAASGSESTANGAGSCIGEGSVEAGAGAEADGSRSSGTYSGSGHMDPSSRAGATYRCRLNAGWRSGPPCIVLGRCHVIYAHGFGRRQLRNGRQSLHCIRCAVLVLLGRRGFFANRRRNDRRQACDGAHAVGGPGRPQLNACRHRRGRSSRQAAGLRDDMLQAAC